MIFYLGTHKPVWLQRTDVPLFVSAVELRKYKKPPIAIGKWALDSGRFSECAVGKPPVPVRQYISEVIGWAEHSGNLQWAAAQDWMCEPFILAKTGLTTLEHQRRTVDNYLELTSRSSDICWMPVIQGYTLDEYLHCITIYQGSGVDLKLLPQVGLGSICRRQGTLQASNIVRVIADLGIKIHAFGFKKTGLLAVGNLLQSSDSMAWSAGARRELPLPGCVGHKKCNNCMKYALQWRESIIECISHSERNAVIRKPLIPLPARSIY